MLVKMKGKGAKVGIRAVWLRLSIDRRCPKYEGKERKGKNKGKGGGLWRREGV